MTASRASPSSVGETRPISGGGAGTDGAFEGRSLDEVTALGAAMRGTRELALESAAQGRALLTTLRQTWPAPLLDAFEAVCRDLMIEPPYACVAGVAAAAHRVPLRSTLVAHLHAVAANLTLAGIRLIPLGQTDGQRITAALAMAVEEIAERALASSLDDLGTAAPVVDWCSMRHETQHTASIEAHRRAPTTPSRGRGKGLPSLGR